MSKPTYALFPLPDVKDDSNYVLDLLGGVVRKRPPTGEEALAQLNALEQRAKKHHDLQARYQLALYLLTHDAPSKFNRKIVSLLREPVHAQMPEALFLMGLLILREQGLKPDPQKAAELILQAAHAGYAEAQKLAARLYDEGIGVEPQPDQALYWLRLAGAAGKAECAREAGLRYRDGQNTPKNLNQAQYWLNIAANNGDAKAQYALSRLLVRLPEKTSQQQSHAQHWLKEAALSGELEAQFRLGLQHWTGQGENINLREALRWTCRSAEGGNLHALLSLSGFFLAGNLLPLDRFKAYVFALYAERRGDHTALVTRQSLESSLTYRERRRAVHFIQLYHDPKSLVQAMIPREHR